MSVMTLLMSLVKATLFTGCGRALEVSRETLLSSCCWFTFTSLM